MVEVEDVEVAVGGLGLKVGNLRLIHCMTCCCVPSISRKHPQVISVQVGRRWNEKEVG